VSQALKEARDDIAFIKDEVVIINDALKSSAISTVSGAAASATSAAIEAKLDTMTRDIESQSQRITQFYDDSTGLMETQLSKLMDLEKASMKQNTALATLSSATETLASALQVHNETVEELNKLR
jgi:uncharacterized phage infection (PIP) family protein YhgE